MRILLIEDEKKVAEFVARGLRAGRQRLIRSRQDAIGTIADGEDVRIARRL